MNLSARLVAEAGGFLNVDKVIADQSKRTDGALKRIGGYLLKTSRNSIRRGVKDKRSPSGLSGDMRTASQAFLTLTGRKLTMNKPSKPGQAPRSHTGNLKAGMSFKVEDGVVVVGALRYKKDGARLLEHGGAPSTPGPNAFARVGLSRFIINGSVRIGFLSKDKTKLLMRQSSQPGGILVRSVKNGAPIANSPVRYTPMAPRPFMGPALTKSLPKLQGFFRG